jgi:phosphonoacetaldehyde hydrolase
MILRAVIFDWAGTMVDFGSWAPVIAMRQAFAGEGVEISDAHVRDGMGLAKIDHIRACLALSEVRDAWRQARGADASEADVGAIFTRLEPLMLEAGAAHAALIPGALETVRALRAIGARIGSTTGYTHAMMAPIAEAAAAQGYAPDVIVCSGDTKAGRPSPLQAWKAMVDLGVYPARHVVKVDDAPAGIREGKSAGCFTIGVAATGNAVGLRLEDYMRLDATQRERRLAHAREELTAAGADLVVPSVAELPAALRDIGLWDDPARAVARQGI